jgi:hypothetical protein
MANTIEIIISNDSDGLVGSEGWDGYDAGASLDNLKQLIADRVAKAYTGYTVTVDDGSLMEDKIYISDDTDDDDYESDENYIRELIGEVWQDWDAWAVEEASVEE